MRVLALSGFLLLSSVAQAQSSFASFEWKRNSRFELQFYYNGTATSLKGNLLENAEAQVVDQGFTLNLKAFPEGFIYAVVAQDFDDKSLVFLLERQNGFFVGMHTQAIPARKITALSDINGILASLKEKNGWDVAIAMRSMVEYFGANSGSQVSNYFDAVEAGQITMIPRPNIGADAVDGGVVQMPEDVSRPPKIQIQEPASEQPVEQPVAEEQPVEDQPVDDQPFIDQPMDLGINNGGVDMEPEQPEQILRPPAEIPADNGGENDGGEFVPMDMTDGWDGDEGEDQDPQWLIEERERQRNQRKRRKDVSDGDIF